MAHVLWIPPIGWEAGSFFWAWMADHFARENPYPRYIFAALALMTLPLVLITHVHNPAVVIGLLTSAMLMAGGFLIVALRSCTLLYPKSNGGLVAGMGAGSWAFLVAILLPILGRLFDHKSYGVAFTVVAIVPLVGAVAWFALTSGSKITVAAPVAART